MKLSLPGVQAMPRKVQILLTSGIVAIAAVSLLAGQLRAAEWLSLEPGTVEASALKSGIFLVLLALLAFFVRGKSLRPQNGQAATCSPFSAIGVQEVGFRQRLLLVNYAGRSVLLGQTPENLVVLDRAATIEEKFGELLERMEVEGVGEEVTEEEPYDA